MPSLNVPQSQFLALPHKFRAFVAGFGSGKTWVGGAGQCKHFWEHPRAHLGYFAPTYAQIRDIYYPTIEEVASDWGLRAEVNQSNHEIHVYSGRVYRGTIICRSLEKPETIIGFKIARGLMDELDVMKLPKAELAWRKAIARLRLKFNGLNGLDVTTTPEGFKFVYQQWVKAIREKPELAAMYGMVQASTYDNELNLPDDYIQSLLASYPPQLIAAYLRGQFVNLASGSVYPNFDRMLNHTDETIREGEALHIGMDFNVLNMTAAVSVIRDGLPRTLEELTKVRDTPTMARMLKERYEAKGHPIVIYPDASGGNTSSKNASESDLTILKEAGFTISVDAANPAVKDRINAVDAMTLNAAGERRWKINTDACPALTEAQEQQAWAPNGEPDKTTGHDHPNDAVGYFLVKRWPIVKRVAQAQTFRM
ncbi:terminase large subunit domain-containing protein [Xenophilus sp. Marseille-Q4582]|uniref:terminase large subunit domain-containing protein n=1 Tax=Xenophilus sp. Marseille-Q4582 TaxID=2866600 RepID=UPI001CE428DD|nr:terminase family protein [Xenophilus sp. Marseille-Q4582]